MASSCIAALSGMCDEVEISLFMYCGNFVYIGAVLLSPRTFLLCGFFLLLLELSMSHVVPLYKAS